MIDAVALFALLGGDVEPVDEAEIRGLVDRAKAGDPGAVDRLYRLHVGRVYRAVRGLCASDGEAEEVTQDAFVRAIVALPRYEPKARFLTWLCAIALNAARQRRRWARRHPEAAAVEVAGSTDPDDALDRERRKRRLLAALDELPERDRQLLSLRYGAELTSGEVAEITGLSEANVRKICERRRKELASTLGEA